MRTALVILNPTSGKEQAVAYQEQIKARLEEWFGEVVVKITQQAGDAALFAAEACRSQVDSIYCMGGDGTVLEAISGIAEQAYRPAVGLLPGGTYNGLARMLGVPADLDEAIASMEFVHTREIDIGKVNSAYFMFILSIGKIAEAVHNVSSEEKSKYGMLSYLYNGVKSALQDEAYPFRIEAGEERLDIDASHIIVALSDYLGDIQLSNTEISQDDGYANLLILKESSVLGKLGVLFDLARQQVEENGHVIQKKVRELSISLREPRPMESDVDGDIGPELPLHIQVLKRHLRVYVPRTRMPLV